MDRQPHRKQNPEFFEPLKIFFAILIVSLVFFAPIVQSEKEGTPTALQEYPALNPFASSADACPWACIKCTDWDPDAWPRTCLTYECTDASGNCGDPGGGGGGPVFQPPTISHVLNCSNTGSNGWCIGTLNLDLTASDPQGQSIVISGTVNGDAFACPSGQTTCSIPLPEAVGTATYKVDSVTGLSANGSTSYHLDVTTPQISRNINGSSGTNNWFISPTSVTALASDTLSGLASLEVNVDNAGWVSYSDTTFMDGMHTIQFRATDNAGNVTETALQTVNVDTTAPTLDLSTTGTTGQNGWYVSAVLLTPTASDATSGLYSLEATTDGVTWTNINTPITLTDGIYTVQFRATDNAGNVSQTPSQQIKVDATTPNLSLDINGIRGQNDWYISSVTVTPNATDVGSGINKIEASVNNGAWGTITSPLSFTDGIHSYRIRVTDNAGNFTETPILPMMVDTVPPAIAIDDDTLDLGDTLNYDLEDSMSGLWINRSVIEDEEEEYKKIVWQEEITGNKSNDNEIRWDGVFPSNVLGTSADGTKAAPGQYFITLKISDQAGNEIMRTAIVEVTAFNSILPIPAFTPPASIVTEPIPSEASTTNEQSFGGANNGNVGTATTTTNGESVFASVNPQAGGTNSFISGNQTTNLPNTNPNILWGAAAAAMLGATLAEWQKKREEEAARLAALIASNAGQGDEDEIPPDVLAKRRGKVIAKNQAKRAQEQAWEAARVQQQAKPANKLAKIDTEEERLEAYKQTAGYQARQESYADYYAKKEQEKQNAVSAARWAGVASLAQTKQESGKNNIFQQISSAISPLMQDASHQWNNFKSTITEPSNSTGSIFGSEKYDNGMLIIQGLGTVIDQAVFKGKIQQTTNNLKQKLETNPTYNAITNFFEFGTGVTFQYLNDNSFGLFEKILHVNWENGGDAFQSGRQIGRVASSIQGAVEFVTGAAAAAMFLSSIPPTGGLTAVCAGATGGACLILGAVAIPTELALAGVSAAVSAHGGATLANNFNNPLQIKGYSGGSGGAKTENHAEHLTETDLPDVKEFIQDAIQKNKVERGYDSFGNMWSLLSEHMAKAGDTTNLFVNRMGDKITGMMKVSTSSGFYEVNFLEGTGNGAGTNLFKQAIEDSLNRGFGGSVTLEPAPKALDWYLKSFPGAERLENGMLHWSAEAARHILEIK